LLRRADQARGVLQREEVRPDSGRKDNVGHFRTFLVYKKLCRSLQIGRVKFVGPQ
jgi:hypothetical protein